MKITEINCVNIDKTKNTQYIRQDISEIETSYTYIENDMDFLPINDIQKKTKEREKKL
jgi:hypothetical protein